LPPRHGDVLGLGAELLPGDARAYLVDVVLLPLAQRASVGVWDTTIMSAFDFIFSRLSRTRGKAGRSSRSARSWRLTSMLQA